MPRLTRLQLGGDIESIDFQWPRLSPLRPTQLGVSRSNILHRFGRLSLCLKSDVEDGEFKFGGLLDSD